MANRPASMICRTGFILLSLALLVASLQAAQESSMELGGGKQKQVSVSWRSSEEYVPVRRVLYRSRSAALPTVAAEVEAVAYEPFELCDGCRCCSASNTSSCVDTNCCYSIDCNLPGKPFGVCAFTPRSCGCGTNNCTQPS